MTQALVDGLAHRARGGATAVSMTRAQVTSQLCSAPTTHPTARIGGDVVCAPAGLNRAREFVAIIERKGEIARSMALPTVLHRFDQIRTAVPFRALIDIG